VARIRSIKPSFFRDEDLQDLERANPGKHTMLVFAGLWGHCDKNGNFEWKPRTLKLDILPFLDFDMAETLEILRADGFLRKYAVDGREYGHIPTFDEHQRITGKEAQDPERFPTDSPSNTGDTGGKQQGGQEGKGREGNKEGKGGDCPHEEIIAAYHETLPTLPHVRQWTAKRKGYLRARWDESAERQTVQWWREFFAYVGGCPFLVGKVGGRDGRASFEADLEWLVTEGNFVKVIEGKYEPKGARL
jgi:hypothetical protein